MDRAASGSRDRAGSPPIFICLAGCAAASYLSNCAINIHFPIQSASWWFDFDGQGVVDAWIHTTSETVDALVSCPLPGTVSVSLAPSRIPSRSSTAFTTSCHHLDIFIFTVVFVFVFVFVVGLSVALLSCGPLVSPKT